MCVHLSHQVVVIHEARCYSPICTEDEDFLKEEKKKKVDLQLALVSHMQSNSVYFLYIGR